MNETTERVRRRRLTRDERRGRILEAAGRMFAEQGYDHALIEQIAEAAGITKPVIYHHFTSKRELYIALLDLYRGELLAFMGRRAVAEASPEMRMHEALDAFFEFVETHPHAWRILFRDPPPSEAALVEAHRRGQERATAAILPLLAAGPTVGHPEDPSGAELVLEREMAAEVIKSATNGLARWWYEHRQAPRDHLVYVLMNVMWVGFDRFVAGERWGLGPESAGTTKPEPPRPGPTGASP